MSENRGCVIGGLDRISIVDLAGEFDAISIAAHKVSYCGDIMSSLLGDGQFSSSAGVEKRLHLLHFSSRTTNAVSLWE